MEKILELESFAGNHITAVCKEAAALAAQSGKPVHFEFNDTHVTAQPGETAEVLQTRWQTDMDAAHEALINSDEYKQRQAQQEADAKAAREAHMIETAMTADEMREAKVPWPQTKEQLVEYIESLVNRSHDYGSVTYAMSMAAEAAFNYVAKSQGCTGFQASFADLDFLRRTRGMKCPFMLIKAEDALYPQYNLVDNLLEAMEKWKPWIKEEAAKKLAEPYEFAHPDVIAHWQKLAK